MIVRKSVKMAVKAKIPVLGFVENMGAMVCPHCGRGIQPLRPGSAANRPAEARRTLLARFPWRKELAQAGIIAWESLPAEPARRGGGASSSSEDLVGGVKSP
jgi:hypothetical protein